MSKFKIRKKGGDLHTLKEYNSYEDGAYNALYPEYAPKSVGGTMSGVRNKDSKGNCTWYAFGRLQEATGYRVPLNKRGDAKDWVVDSHTAKIGSVVVFVDSGYGHVAFVEDIMGNDIILSESSYSERGNDFLFKYGRTVEEVCKVWGMSVKGYVTSGDNHTSYNESNFKVGDNVIVTGFYHEDASGSKRLGSATNFATTITSVGNGKLPYTIDQLGYIEEDSIVAHVGQDVNITAYYYSDTKGSDKLSSATNFNGKVTQIKRGDYPIAINKLGYINPSGINPSPFKVGQLVKLNGYYYSDFDGSKRVSSGTNYECVVSKVVMGEKKPFLVSNPKTNISLGWVDEESLKGS